MLLPEDAGRRELMKQTGTGKWVMLLPEDAGMFEDFRKLLKFKRKPDKK